MISRRLGHAANAICTDVTLSRRCMSVTTLANGDASRTYPAAHKEIRQHCAKKLRSVLLVVRRTHLNACNLGRLLQRPGEQIFLFQRLWAVARVDATRA